MKREIIFLALILISACTTTTPGSSDQTSWRTGSEGIVMTWVPDNPPSEVVSTQKFNAIVKYSNKGAARAENVQFFLTGYDPNILKRTDNSGNPGSIEGKTQYNPEGSQEAFKEWGFSINMAGLSQSDSFKQTLSPTICYKYYTLAIPNICIDPSEFDVVGPTKCDYSVRDLGSSQGGPIAVSKVEKKATADKVYLEIEVTNKGKGTPYPVGVGDCMNLKYDQVDKIDIKVDGYGCNPSTIRLTNNKGFSVCTGNVPKTMSETPLTIRLNYRYRETLSKKEITIVNVQPKT